MLTITQLYHYPIKSCAGIAVDQLMLNESTPLLDRHWLVVDQKNQFVTQRQVPAMAHVIPFFDEGRWYVRAAGHAPLLLSTPASHDLRQVSVWRDTMLAQDMGDNAAQWFSTVLNRPVRLVVMCDATRRYVDPNVAHAPQSLAFADGFPLLVIHQQSLDFLSTQLGRTLDAERFRANVIISGGLPFDEQQWSQLYSLHGPDTYLAMVKPCERCVIPTRNPVTLTREDDVLALLKHHCRPEKAIIFGQNAQAIGLTTLTVGDAFSTHKPTLIH